MNSFVSWVASVVIVLPACTTSSTQANDDSGVGAVDPDCSTGPSHEAGESIPFGEGANQTWPSCVPHCGAIRNGRDGFYRIDALPSGACVGTQTCSIGIEYLCTATCPDAGTPYGPINGYVCRCISGTWSCVNAMAGGSTCGCGP